MARSYIRAPIRQREDARLLTGRANYVDDIRMPGMVHAALLRSAEAHTKILAIDTGRIFLIRGSPTAGK